MKKHLFYTLGSSLLATLFLGCQTPKSNIKPTPVHVDEKPYIRPEPIVEEKEIQEPDFMIENLTKEDEYNRVFLDCFATGKVRASKKCTQQINSFLAQTPLRNKRQIFIDVHTDLGGSSDSNMRISKQRAQSLAASLFHKEYVHSKVFSQGFGEQKPLYMKRSDEADRKNRRVVVHLREKDSLFDKKEYTPYVRAQKKVKKREMSSVKSSKKESQKQKAIDLKVYTGEADTGWIYFGKSSNKKKFSISCEQDSYVSGKMRSVEGVESNRFISGIHNKTVVAKDGKTTFVFAPISIFDDAYATEKSPNIVITQEHNKKRVLTTEVNSYNGRTGILYRLFVNKKNSPKSSLECVDLVFDYVKGDLKFGVAYFRVGKGVVSRELSGF